jgi:hypothetical protein
VLPGLSSFASYGNSDRPVDCDLCCEVTKKNGIENACMASYWKIIENSGACPWRYSANFYYKKGGSHSLNKVKNQ